jgi:glycosyltransferase involved in cell wall biosynthesis
MPENKERNVLIFAYYWPPASGPGVWRFIQFTKYFKALGWNPIVITVANGSYQKTDDSLVNEIDASIQVYRTKEIEPFTLFNLLRGKKGNSVPELMGGVKENESLFYKFSKHVRSNWFVPDPHIGWIPSAVKKAKEVMQSVRVDAIITTSTPNSVHLIGRRLKQYNDVPWIMDFRDPWVSNFLNKDYLKRTPKTEKKDLALETNCLQMADGMVGVTPGLVEEYKNRSNRSAVIYNGFDASDFPVNEGATTNKFELNWVGSLKSNMDVVALWQAIDEVYSEEEGFSSDFQLNLVGNINNEIRTKLNDYKFSRSIVDVGFVNHQEAIRFMREATALLFMVPQTHYSKNIATGKIFEYIASATPLLSIGPVDGVAAEILSASDNIPMHDYNDKKSIKDALLNYYRSWKSNGGRLNKLSNENVQQFNRENLAKKYVAYLNEIVGND